MAAGKKRLTLSQTEVEAVSLGGPISFYETLKERVPWARLQAIIKIIVNCDYEFPNAFQFLYEELHLSIFRKRINVTLLFLKHKRYINKCLL